MLREILKRIWPEVPDELVIFENTNHALRYAADTWHKESVRVRIEADRNDLKYLYRQRKDQLDRNLNELALMAFQIQFQNEFIQETRRLRDLSEGSPHK